MEYCSSNFRLIQRKNWPTKDFDLTVPDLYLKDEIINFWNHRRKNMSEWQLRKSNNL